MSGFVVPTATILNAHSAVRAHLGIIDSARLPRFTQRFAVTVVYNMKGWLGDTSKGAVDGAQARISEGSKCRLRVE